MRIFTSEIDELAYLATENGIHSKCVSNNVNHIFINKKPYEIYAYNGGCDEHEELQFRSNTLSLLYTCINCELGEWIRDQLFKIIEPMPVLYHLSFLNTPLENVYFMTYVKGSDPFLRNLVAITEEFINILLNFQNMYLDVNDTSADTQLSTTLLKLNFAINVINKKFENDHYQNKKPTDVDIVRVVLEALNSIQNFTYLNCKINIHYDNKQFYGFSMKKEDELPKNIEEFLQDIKSLNLKKYKNCNTNQMLLLKVITEMNGKFEWKILGEIIKVSTIIEIILLTEDLSKLFWYQKYVFNTLMTLLLEKIQVHYSSQSTISKDVWNMINNLISSMKLLEIVNLQPNLHKFLSLLKSNNENIISHDFLNEVNGYIMSSPIVIIDNDSNISDFLDYINNFIDDIICFAQIFKHLSYKFNDIIYDDQKESFTDKIKIFEQEIMNTKYKTTTKHEMNIVLEEENNSLANIVTPNLHEYNIKGCQLFTNLYHYFYKCIIDLNRASSEDKGTYKKENKYNYYPGIKNNLITVFQKIKELLPGYQLFPHLKTILNIVPHIELREELLFTEYYHNELTRTIYALMTELNTYGIEYCTPPYYNFLLFNNINFDVIPQLKNIKNLIEEPVNSLKNTNSILFLTDDWYKNILRPITKIMERLEEFRFYDKIIEQNWKGEKITLVYLYDRLKNTTLSSSNALAVLEFSLKFFFAMLFYEIDINSTKNDILNNETFVKEILEHLDNRDFPKKYKSIKADISYYISHNNDANEKNKMKNNILNGLNNVGVFIKYPEPTIPFNNTKTSSSGPSQNIQNFFEDIIYLLNYLNEAIYSLEFFDDI